tara:strand:+ start:24408 stop:24719 length:312 start_codon:yes stop_codon:yes gene_type:complete
MRNEALVQWHDDSDYSKAKRNEVLSKVLKNPDKYLETKDDSYTVYQPTVYLKFDVEDETYLIHLSTVMKDENGDYDENELNSRAEEAISGMLSGEIEIEPRLY